jgi:anionic cell wall polymer biosynthesis LytR-Cps2A-Psr (LCP) family protein
MFNQKGQAGSVFKILIGAVVGLAIVGIIYSIIVVMSGQKAYLSEEIFSNKIKMAMKNPTGQEQQINDYLFFKGKVLAKKSLSEQTGLNESCISINKDNASVDYISFEKDTMIDLGIKCELNQNECQVFCSLFVYDQGKFR